MRMTLLALGLAYGLSGGSAVVCAGEAVGDAAADVTARPAEGAGQAETAPGEGDASFIEPGSLAMVSPTYPIEAVEAGMTGSVVVCFSVSDTGAVSNAHVLSSTHELFDGPAVEAASQSRFKPARRNGVAVAHDMCLRYRFRL